MKELIRPKSQTRPVGNQAVGYEGFAIESADLNDPPVPKQIESCKQWLERYAVRKRTASINSYSLKHIIEDRIGEYVSNGACIVAAIELGFTYSVGPSRINANFEMELRLPEDEWSRAQPRGFSRWLFRQDSSLAQDAKIDPNWPRVAQRFIDFWRYLRCDGSGGLDDELCDAWETWSGKMAPRPDLIDTDIVYRRQCDFIKYGDSYPIADKDSTFLYALTEVDSVFNSTRVRYVGQAISPAKRLNDHIKRPGSIDRVKWIGRMLNKDEYPEMAIFYSGAARSMANSLEKAAIYAFQECETRWDDQIGGFPPFDDALLNIDK